MPAARLCCILMLILMLGAGLAQAGEPPREPAYLCTDEQAQADERCPAQVVLVRRGWVVIEAQRPLRVGERFRLLSQRTVRRSADAQKNIEEFPLTGTRTGILVLERVSGLQGAGRLVRNAYAEPGDAAVPTRQFRETLVYGRRFPGTWRVRGDVWAGPALGDRVGLGLWTQGAVEYRFGVPLKLAVELGPGIVASGLGLPGPGFTTVSMGTVVAASLRGVVGLALSGFELSLGLGGSLDTGRLDDGLLQMSIGARFGSLDGLHLDTGGYFFLPDRGRPATFDSAAATFNIPVHRRVTLVLAAAGGLPFWVYSTVGLRIYAHGTGGPGTTIIGFSLGGFGLTERRQCPPPSTASLECVTGSTLGGGPLFQLGFDHRF